jgi:hypothetical protein
MADPFHVTPSGSPAPVSYFTPPSGSAGKDFTTSNDVSKEATHTNMASGHSTASPGMLSFSEHPFDGEDSGRSDLPVFDLPTTGADSENSTALGNVLADAAPTTITTAQPITSAGTSPSSEHHTDGEDSHRSDSLKSTPRHAVDQGHKSPSIPSHEDMNTPSKKRTVSTPHPEETPSKTPRHDRVEALQLTPSRQPNGEVQQPTPRASGKSPGKTPRKRNTPPRPRNASGRFSSREEIEAQQNAIVIASPVATSPVVVGPSMGRPLSTYSKAELDAASGEFIRMLKGSAYEIIAAISGHLFDFDLIIKQNKPLDPKVPFAQYAVKAMRFPAPCLRAFSPLLGHKFMSQDTIYPIITFDVSDPNGDWFDTVRHWKNLSVNKLVLEVKGFDKAHVHGLGNLVEFVAQSKMWARCDNHGVHLVTDRSFAVSRAHDDHNREVLQQRLKSGIESDSEEYKQPIARKPLSHVLLHLPNMDKGIFEGIYDMDILNELASEDSEVERRQLVYKLIDIGRDLRASGLTHTRATFTRAVFVWAVSATGKSDSSERKIKKICKRSIPPVELKAAAFPRWYGRLSDEVERY